MRFILYAIFVHINSVVCLNENVNSNQDVVQGRYNFNHPPGIESYNPLPISEVYEDDTDIEPDIEVFTQKSESNIQEKLLANVALEETSTVITESITSNKQDDITLETKARASSDLQIPVAVVYDSTTPGNSQSHQSDNSSRSRSNRRKYKQIRRRKQQNKAGAVFDNPVIQTSTPVKPQIETTSKINNIELVRPQPRIIELTPHSEYRTIQNLAEPNTNSKPRKRVRDPVVPIIYEENHVYSHNGNFHYSYEGGDGTKAHSDGKLLKSDDNQLAGEAVSGGFSYTDKDGNDFSLSYTADENGYRPIGAHLPTPPPIPPAIARALAYLATATTPEPVTKPSVKRTRVSGSS